MASAVVDIGHPVREVSCKIDEGIAEMVGKGNLVVEGIAEIVSGKDEVLDSLYRSCGGHCCC